MNRVLCLIAVIALGTGATNCVQDGRGPQSAWEAAVTAAS